MKPRLIVIGPLPPPYHGVAVSTSLVLANPLLSERFDVVHLDTTDSRPLDNVGRWDVVNAAQALKAVARLTALLRGEPGVVYLPISQGIPGLARDTLFIHAAAARGWKVAAHLRGSELGGIYRKQPRPVRAWLRGAFRRIDSLAVLGESVRGVLEGLIPPERVAVVPNGTPDPGPPNGRAAERGLFLGNLYLRKGVREAMEAALLVTERRPQARFVFAGASPDEGSARTLRSLAERAEGRIEVLPPVLGDDKRRLLEESSFLLFPPSRQEGHPRVVLEAIAAGLPVITTDRGIIAETVVDGESGFVLPAPVPSELAARMIELLDDPEQRRRMGEAARRRYLERFTEEAADRTMAEWLSALV